MPYRLPTFNLLCNIGKGDVLFDFWPVGKYVGAPRIADQPCALVFGRRVNAPQLDAYLDGSTPKYLMSLLLPKLTDIRATQSADGFADAVEVPAGSGRWYGVGAVDDIGKGYANEHRSALLVAIFKSWTVPYG